VKIDLVIPATGHVINSGRKSLVQGYRNPEKQDERGTKFCTLAHNVFVAPKHGMSSIGVRLRIVRLLLDLWKNLCSLGC